jgi:hypothetical protein
MGLDMYMYSAKKVKGLNAKDYERADNAVSSLNVQESFIPKVRESIKGKSKQIFDELDSSVKVRGEYLNWYSIFEQVGYLRKANAIHHFFVQECQNGVDECQLSIVKKTHLKDLLKRCKRAMKLKKIYLNDGIIKNDEGLESFLPTQSGFFFGGTEFDEWYFQGVAETKKIITKVLKNTDFDKQVILYRASW